MDATTVAVERLLTLHDGDEQGRAMWDASTRESIAEFDARALAQLEHRTVGEGS